MTNEINARLERLEERIEAACGRSGRKRQDIRLMAVTKFQPPENLEAAWNAGVRLFGESRVQEGTEKFSPFRETHCNFELHLIGSLQRNKAKKAAAFFDCIQSVDRMELIDCLGGLTMGRESPLMILLEYHTGEESKAGFESAESLYAAAEKALSYPGLNPAGLMTMAPLNGDTKTVRSSFSKLAALRDELEKRFPGGSAGIHSARWPCLSMGMTGDFETAIEEGATLIRIGTAIFGER